jgi:hypothetical protein
MTMHDPNRSNRKIIDLDTKDGAIANLRQLLKHDDSTIVDAAGFCGCLAWATIQRTGGGNDA